MDESKENPGQVTPEAPTGTAPTEPAAAPFRAPATPPPADRDEDAEQAARVQPPEENEGSGQFAVWDHDLGQFVSGVSDKATANRAKKDLEGHNGAITDGHNLETREV